MLKINNAIYTPEISYSINGYKCPDPQNIQDWVFQESSSGMFLYPWRKKTIEEKEYEEALKIVNEIAPGWKD